VSRSLVVLGARNLGGHLLERFGADGWKTAAVARSEDTLEAIRARGSLALRADATDPEQLAEALATARAELGALDVVVNAMSVAVPEPGEPWGGGPLADAQLAGWERWSAAISRMAFVFLTEGARALRAGGGGTLIQTTNGAATRSAPGQGPLSAGHQGLRALVRSAAEELRTERIRACLLVADGPILSPKTAARIEADGLAGDAVLTQDAIADAIAFLAGQDDGGLTYELVLRPRGLPWIPS
jgi:NAD(P)-dependent dehydrogenase (short-subunit alcohol dehydrogenase family)